MVRFTWCVVVACLLSATRSEAQPLGTYRWQLQPYCNVLSLQIEQKGGIYVLEGTDDQCGASKASVTGLAFLNPSGQIGMGLSAVTTPGARPVHIDVTLALPALSGTWSDQLGNSGTFVFTPGAGTGGSPRPVPTTTTYNLFTDPAANFVGIGRSNRISGNEVFGIRAPAGAGTYGGMYVEGSDAASWPFYGFATNGSFRAWTYYDGQTGAWRLYNAGIRLTVENEGNVVIGPYSEPASPTLGAQLEFRGGAGSDFVRAYDGTNIRFRITSVGNVTADGTFTSPAADFAELLPAASNVSAGDVLVIAADGQLQRSSRPYQASVAGVHSTKPAFLGGDRPEAEPGRVPLAVMGVVPVRATTENGAIRPGDLLTTSSLAGHAMRCDGVERCFGRTVGKALTALDTGTGMITVLVMLQ
jgi:hypothetical protein